MTWRFKSRKQQHWDASRQAENLLINHCLTRHKLIGLFGPTESPSVAPSKAIVIARPPADKGLTDFMDKITDELLKLKEMISCLLYTSPSPRD